MADVLNTESLDSLVEAAAALVDQLKANEKLIGNLVGTIDTLKTEADDETPDAESISETLEFEKRDIDLVHRHLISKYPEFNNATDQIESNNVTGHIDESINTNSDTLVSDIAMLEKMVESRRKRNAALCEVLDGYDEFLHTECVPRLTQRLRNDSGTDAVMIETSLNQKHRLVQHRLWPLYQEYVEMTEALGQAEKALNQVSLLDNTTLLNLVTSERIASLGTC